MTSEQQHILHWIARTQERLQEISVSQESLTSKRIRAATNLCFLLGEIVSTSFPQEVQTAMHHLIESYMRVDANQKQEDTGSTNSAKDTGGAI